MLGRGLFFIAVFVAAVAVVHQSIPAAISAGLIGVFGLAAKNLE
jgi:hypothetical protein